MDGADGAVTSDGDRRVVWTTGIASAVLFAFAILAAVSGTHGLAGSGAGAGEER